MAYILCTTGHPVASVFQQLDMEKLEAVKKESLALEAAGVVRCSTSPWASPLHIVRKADSSWQPCGDNCHLNTFTGPDTYPILNMMDFIALAVDCTVFSKINLNVGTTRYP